VTTSTETGSNPEIPYRRIGAILVEWNLITDAELTQALAEQERTGSLLGEILVSTYGVSRVDLADALAEQWHEAHRAATLAAESGVSAAYENRDEALAESDLRVLLDEAEAARAELAVKTDELSKRIESLEQLVVGVTQALDELRSEASRDAGKPNAATRPSGSRRSRSRAGGRTQGPNSAAA
jgi:HPt (histidine-containing phosphotransfer) domain-containing protein